MVSLIHEAAFAFEGDTRRVVAWNAHAEALFGRAEDEALGIELDAFLAAETPFDATGISAGMRRLGVRRRDGSIHPAHASFSPLPRAGEREHVLAIVRLDTPLASMDEPAARSREAAEREPLFRRVFERAATGIALTDLKGQFIECNPAFQALVGFKQRELRHLSILALCHPDDRGKDAQHFKELLDGKREFYGITQRLIHKDGSILWCQATVSLVRDAEGRPLYGIGLVNDITEQQRAAQRAAIQLSMTQILAENPTNNMAMVQVMQAICKELDWQIGEYWTPDESQAHLRRQVNWQVPGFDAIEFNVFTQHLALHAGEGLPGRVWETGTPAWISDVLRDQNFLRRPMAQKAGIKGALAFPIRNASEVLGVMVFAYRDFRQPDDSLLAMMAEVGAQIGQFIVRKRAERHLKLLGALVNSVGDAIVGIDPRGTITSWNQAAERLFGYRSSEALGRPSLSLFPPEAIADLAAAQDLVRSGLSATRIETLALNKLGAHTEVWVTHAPITDEEGKFSGLAMTVTPALDR